MMIVIKNTPNDMQESWLGRDVPSGVAWPHSKGTCVLAMASRCARPALILAPPSAGATPGVSKGPLGTRSDVGDELTVK